jgi:hypothetical protein
VCVADFDTLLFKNSKASAPSGRNSRSSRRSSPAIPARLGKTSDIGLSAGNLPAVVSEDEGMRTANERSVPSAKDGTNFETAFMELADRATRRKQSESVTVRCDGPSGGNPQAKQCC